MSGTLEVTKYQRTELFQEQCLICSFSSSPESPLWKKVVLKNNASMSIQTIYNGFSYKEGHLSMEGCWGTNQFNDSAIDS